MNNPERFSKVVTLCAALALVAGMQDRLGNLLLVNRLAIQQMRGEFQPPKDPGAGQDWYLVDYVVGRGLRLTSSYSAAIPWLERALALGGALPPVLLELGLAHLRQGSPEEALDYLRQVPGIAGSEKFNYLVDSGWREVLLNRDLPDSRRDWAAAERFYRAAVALSPQNRLAHRALIELYLYWAPDADNARAALGQAQGQFPDWEIGEAYGKWNVADDSDSSQRQDAAQAVGSDDPHQLESEGGAARTAATEESRTVRFGPAGTWSDPALIFQTGGKINHPFLVADDAGTVHCLWAVDETEAPGNSFGVYYASLRGSVWTRPVRIHRDSWAAFVTALPSRTGTLVAVWSAPEHKLVSRSLDLSGSADGRAWSSPLTIARGRGTSHLAQDASGRIHYVFPGRPLGIFHQLAENDGRNWTRKHLVETTRGKGVNEPVLVIDPDQVLHVVWTEYELPNGWPPTGVFYSQSKDLGRSWASPFRIAAPGYDQGTILALSSRELHVVFNGMVGIGGRYHRLSRDGGLNWSPLAQISTQGATDGLPCLAADDSGRLHLLTTTSKQVLYGSFAGERWTSLSEITSGEALRDQGAMTLAGDGVLHAVYWENLTHLYHRSLILEDTRSPRPGVERRNE